MSDPERLLLALLAFANGEEFPRRFRAGVYRDGAGAMVLHAVRQGAITPRVVRRLRAQARRLLIVACRGADAIEATLNAKGIPAVIASPPRTRRWALVRPSAGPGRLLPMIREARDWPAAVMVVALLDQVGRGDVLGNRIAQCEACARFHLLPTGRPSRFCSRTCRKQTG